MMEDRHCFRYKRWDYFVVSIFVFSSGAVFWKGFLSAAVTYSLLIFVAFYNAFYLKKDTKGNSSFLYIVFCAILCVLNLIINYSPLLDNRIFGFFFSMFATYLIISRYDYYYFRHILLDVIYILVLIGIPVFVLVENNLLPTSLIPTITLNYRSFGIFVVGWDSGLFGRFACIWHEPGACQIALNTVLWMHFDCIYKWQWVKGQLFKCFVIFIGSILTFSTGSYLCLMFLLLSVLIKSNIKGKHKILLSTLLVFTIPLAIYLFFNSPVIQNKLFDSEGENISKVTRYSDIEACWRMTVEEPVLGYGLGSKAFNTKSVAYGNNTTSSGILGFTASWGVTWFIIYLIFLIRGTQRIKQGKIVSALIVLSSLIMQFNEAFIELPISCVFLFQYCSYNKCYG